MKVIIWVNRKDVVSNKITEYYVNESELKAVWSPKEYVQIVISQNAFAQLEDKEGTKKWIELKNDEI